MILPPIETFRDGEYPDDPANRLLESVFNLTRPNALAAYDAIGPNRPDSHPSPLSPPSAEATHSYYSYREEVLLNGAKTRTWNHNDPYLDRTYTLTHYKNPDGELDIASFLIAYKIPNDDKPSMQPVALELNYFPNQLKPYPYSLVLTVHAAVLLIDYDTYGKMRKVKFHKDDKTTQVHERSWFRRGLPFQKAPTYKDLRGFGRIKLPKSDFTIKFPTLLPISNITQKGMTYPPETGWIGINTFIPFSIQSPSQKISFFNRLPKAA